MFSDGSNGFIAGVAFLYISYAGVTKIAAIAGEIKNPAKNLPLTMIISLFLITTIYCMVALALVGTLKPQYLQQTLSQFTRFSKQSEGTPLG